MRRVFLIPGLAALGVLPLTATNGAQATPAPVVVAATPTSSAHPYSDPVWYPVRDEVQVGCGHSNPGCDRPHHFWTQILTPLGQKPGHTSRAGVFSMGSGIAHIGEANGDACGSGDASYGTWVWVDHGGGDTSRYGHLSSIAIREGQLVGPGDLLGIMGVSGKRSSDSCYRSYLDFQLKTHGARGDDYEFRTLLACRGNSVEIWPTAVTRDARWNDVQQGTKLPATSSSCLPTGVPATVDAPSGVKLKNTKGDKLKASWNRAPRGVDKVRVEFSQYRNGSGKYDDQHRSVWKEYTSLSTTSVKLKAIDNRKYRVRVWFHTAGVGWAKGSGWAKARVK